MKQASRIRRSARAVALVAAMLIAVVCPAASVSETAAAADEPESDARPTKTVKLFVENWKWTPNVIRVQQGTRLVLKFESVDAPHAFLLKGYGIKVPLPQDSKRETSFVVDKAGTFRWRCGRPCGNGCPKMTGKLIVE